MRPVQGCDGWSAWTPQGIHAVIETLQPGTRVRVNGAGWPKTVTSTPHAVADGLGVKLEGVRGGLSLIAARPRDWANVFHEHNHVGMHREIEVPGWSREARLSRLRRF